MMKQYYRYGRQIFLIFLLAATQMYANKIYWTDAGSDLIESANLDGSSRDTILSGVNVVEIALDNDAGKMYWSDNAADNISRANLDGSGIEVLISGLNNPLGIAINADAGEMYYIVESDGDIKKANLDGSNPQPLITSGLGDPRYITLDVDAGKMYWTDAGTDKIQRANLNGSNIENLVTGLIGPFGIALDIPNGKMYWSENSEDKIQRSNLDGSNVETLLSRDGLAPGPVGLKLDLENGHIYWVDDQSNSLKRSNLDGTQVVEIVTGLDSPVGVALGGLVNSPPVSNAGEDQTVHPGETVDLTGSNSTDPDGDYPLTFSWTLVSSPTGSQAAIDDVTSETPSFVTDFLGDYSVELIVTDSKGLSGVSDLLNISTENSLPVAAAGEDQVINIVGTLVHLDGSGSSDDDGDEISYSWNIIQKPPGSLANLDDLSVSTPQFTADLNGEYQIELAVSDAWGQSSPDVVVVSFNNVAPVADAGVSGQVIVGSMVYLDGSNSSDGNGDALSFSWNIISKPDGSLADLSNTNDVLTDFYTDVSGEYLVGLIVNDGIVASAPDNVSIYAISIQDALSETLLEISNEISSLPNEVFKNKKNRKRLLKRINKVNKHIGKGKIAKAHRKLTNKILTKTDGCAVSGEPDKKDKIVVCEGGQDILYPLILEALGYLEDLL